MFGFDAYKPMIARANDVNASEYQELVRKADAHFEGRERALPDADADIVNDVRNVVGCRLGAHLGPSAA